MPDDDKPNPVLPPVENLRDAEVLLLRVFQHILHHHGLDKTRAMFANYVNEPATADLDQMSKLQVLERLLEMKPKPNMAKLARDMVAENAALPAEKQDLRLSYRDEEQRLRIMRNLEQWIRRDVWRKREELKARVSPTSPPLRSGEPAKFKIVPTARLPFRSRKN